MDKKKFFESLADSAKNRDREEYMEELEMAYGEVLKRCEESGRDMRQVKREIKDIEKNRRKYKRDGFDTTKSQLKLATLGRIGHCCASYSLQIFTIAPVFKKVYEDFLNSTEMDEAASNMLPKVKERDIFNFERAALPRASHYDRDAAGNLVAYKKDECGNYIPCI